MSKQRRLPVALTIAGSDSGGGAGIQADLKTFASLDVHGTSAITCLTAQNPRQVRALEAISPGMVRDQIEAVFAELRPAAVKTGMLYSAKIVREVARFFRRERQVPLIVDPVSLASSGARLLQYEAVACMRDELLPRASLVTPNLDEAELLLGREVRSIAAMREAARELKARYGCAALVKGGHLLDVREAVDIYYDGRTELLLKASFVGGVSTHGTGCVYSAAITAYVALGDKLPLAVEKAKHYVTHAINRSVRARGHCVLNCFWRKDGRSARPVAGKS